MVTVTQSTTRSITAKSGMILPATITPETDFNAMVMAISLYHLRGGQTVAYDTLERVMAAMRDASAVVVLYVGLDGGQDARVLWPSSISFTKEHKIVAKCYCTMRRQWKTFRLDRMLTCHMLTTPDDIEAAA